MKKAFFPLSIFLFFLLGFTQPALAYPWTGIIDNARAIDWTQSGVPGGIPNRTTVCATINASAYGNGSSDATSGIQSALNSCPANQVVMLSAGTFRINGSISIPGNVTLRGSGPRQTILKGYGSSGRWSGMINIGTDMASGASSNSTEITGGSTLGSTNITVSSASGISAGSYLVVTELNDPNLVSLVGTGGDACTWCDFFGTGQRTRGQIVEVTSVSGNNVAIKPALYSNYSRTPWATRMNARVKYAGVEDLQVYMNNTGYGNNIAMSGSAYSWIKNIESNFTDADHVKAIFSYRNEIRDSYFHDGYYHQSGQSESCVFLGFNSSALLVENNILTRLHGSIVINWGSAGNVIAYNFMDGNYNTARTYNAFPNIAMHGPHPQFNLIEGNVATNAKLDSYWGSDSHNTFFRNWFKGTTQVCDPTAAGVRSPITSNCHWTVQATRGFDIQYESLYENLVGNIVGSSELEAMVGTTVAYILATVKRGFENSPQEHSFGYTSDSDPDGSSNGLAYSTAFIHGEYTLSNNSVLWNSGNTNRNLAASYYKASKPSWWNSSPWPAIGPDVAGGTGPGGHTYATPAQACYANTAKDSNGYLLFDAKTCYASSGITQDTTPPAAPSGLAVN